MPDTAPRVRATILQGLAPLLAAGKGPGLPQMLIDVGIDPAVLTTENADIPLAHYARLLDQAAAFTGEDCFGIRLARVFPIGGTGVLGYLVRNAPDLRTFVTCLKEYAPLQMDAFSLDFEEEKGIARLAWSIPDRFPAPRKQLIEFLMSVVVLRIRAFYGSDWLPTSAEFEYRQPRCSVEYHELFGRCLKFGASCNRITIRSEALTRCNATADYQLFKTLRIVADDQLRLIKRSREGLKGASGTDLLTRLDEYIRSNLDSGQIDIEGAAKAMGLGVREFQSELRRRDTSLGQEMSRVRHGLAERYLRETLLPMSEIAFLLGFSELSAFTRAARGWFDMTPTAFRQKSAVVPAVGAVAVTQRAAGASARRNPDE